MAFRFSLESVLKHRGRLEDIAQREYAEAQQAVDLALRKLEQMYARLDEVREEIAKAQSSHSNHRLDEVRSMEDFISGHKVRIENLRQETRTLLMVAEQKQEALIESAREKKVLVKLKERRLHEYRARLQAIDVKNMDDQTMMRHAWGKK